MSWAARTLAGPEAWRWWLVLVVLCLIPRAVVAWKTQIPCSDGTYYLSLAQRLDQPPIVPKDAYYMINPFVLLLALWEGWGWDPLTAGKAFNVFIGSLTVLPLVGWVRRQFDEQVAWLVALGYAVHPKLVQWSGELVRDPLFWFLVACSVNLGWRVCRQRNQPWWTLPLLAVVLALAWQTRVEGLGLYGVLLLWLLFSPAHPLRKRVTLVVQAVLWSAAAGVLIWWGLWLAGGNPQWQWGTLMRFRTLVLGPLEAKAPSGPARPQPRFRSLHSRQGNLPDREAPKKAPPVPEKSPPSPVVPPSVPVAWSLGNKLFLEAVSQGFGYLYGVLLLLSMVVHWRHWLRLPVVAVTLWSLAVLVFVWIHVQREGGTSTRYVVAPAMLALPTAALGWQWLLGALDVLFLRASGKPGHLRKASQVGIAVAFLVGHLFIALSREDQGRLRCAELGRWIARHQPRASVAGMANWSLIQYYTHGPFHPINALPDGACYTDIPLLVEQTQPEYVLLCRRRLRRLGVEQLLKTLQQMGYRPVDSLPQECRNFAILLQRAVPAGAVQQARGKGNPQSLKTETQRH